MQLGLEATAQELVIHNSLKPSNPDSTYPAWVTKCYYWEKVCGSFYN